MPEKLLKGKTVRLVVTMGMPVFSYCASYGVHSVRSFKQNILALAGTDPLETSLIGNVEGSANHRDRWLPMMHSSEFTEHRPGGHQASVFPLIWRPHLAG